MSIHARKDNVVKEQSHAHITAQNKIKIVKREELSLKKIKISYIYLFILRGPFISMIKFFNKF